VNLQPEKMRQSGHWEVETLPIVVKIVVKGFFRQRKTLENAMFSRVLM